MRRNFDQREAYALHRFSEGITRLLHAQSGTEITQATRWIKAWCESYRALSEGRRLLQRSKQDNAQPLHAA